MPCKFQRMKLTKDCIKFYGLQNVTYFLHTKTCSVHRYAREPCIKVPPSQLSHQRQLFNAHKCLYSYLSTNSQVTSVHRSQVKKRTSAHLDPSSPISGLGPHNRLGQHKIPAKPVTRCVRLASIVFASQRPKLRPFRERHRLSSGFSVRCDAAPIDLRKGPNA